jgi:hypothetical protein
MNCCSRWFVVPYDAAGGNAINDYFDTRTTGEQA